MGHHNPITPGGTDHTTHTAAETIPSTRPNALSAVSQQPTADYSAVEGWPAVGGVSG